MLNIFKSLKNLKINTVLPILLKSDTKHLPLIARKPISCIFLLFNPKKNQFSQINFNLKKRPIN